MALHSRWSQPIPKCSLQQWIFGSSNGPMEDADKSILIDADRPDTHFLTKSQYRLLSKQVALGLIKNGVQPQSRVLVFSANNVYFPSVFLGILMAGGIFTGANPSFTPRELAYQLQNSEATHMFVHAGQLPTALKAAEEVGLKKENIFVLDPSVLPPVGPNPALPAARDDGLRLWTELIADNHEQAKSWQWVEPQDPEDTACCLNYSSGTTGVPKGVEISHFSYVANGSGVVMMSDMEPDPEHRKHAKGLAFLPMYHAYAQTYYVSIYPKVSIPAYIMPSFDFEKMLQHIQRFRVTSLLCVPPILVYLSKHPLVKKYDLSSVNRVSSGAAPLSHEVIHNVEKLWPSGDVTVKQGWGMTEVTCTCMTWDPRHKTDPDKVGELAPNCSAKIMELDGKTQINKPNERGELWVTGPTLMKGYWKNPSATESTISVDEDGTRWLKTGDIAYVDAFKPGGIFHIVDRIKELIKVKGNQVAPAELEAVLLDHPEIADAAVIGIPFEGDEAPRAYIVKAPGSQLTEKQVVDWMESRVARYKRLKGGATFVDMIPKNPSGKILRRALRDKAKAEMDANKAPSSRL
ncbi:hypothetical protein SNK03_006282 [Fusarium graminearum]|uniref:Chromosome 2, complete genome n=3 Tax=Fusarium sambucinum species complex TaxID=569360 RepID=I1RIF7_GIBZE|nr:hypothetical protein FGSG_03589 [Fusarium graminearum PH-1]KAI6774389.1 hypothetical protein HG531_001238 [Fusarium graminearum]PTD07441.1 4-coumarate-CoA ligase-like protein 7 [Fusarium culmorum]ESU09617.1 hypothetical protein FGSG_03589 [Fusarium graminearum PH-1]QPC59649.1 hypothetical protein HYE67_001880 [Fusarium culmorum]CAF3468646.1 unnamed protein product [Fusarium graminearum]|eukprot:XP_011322116.1 hypothetical protein FGSG_03589 [Fusarium graminearum PH-1]